MAFTELEIAEHMQVLEDCFWSRRRPALHLRDKIREGQRITDQTIELFHVRPRFNRPHEQIECPIAKVRYVRTQKVWRLFWKRADNKWHVYPCRPKVATLAEALRVIDEDAKNCFFG